MKKLFYFAILMIATVLLSCGDDSTAPTVNTGDWVHGGNPGSVACSGRVVDDGGDVVFDRGICYISGDGVATTSNFCRTGGSGRGSYTCVLTNLSTGTYTYRAYASNSKGTSYGECSSFTVSNSGSDPGGGGSGGGGSGGGNLTIDDFVGSYTLYGTYNTQNAFQVQWNVTIGYTTYPNELYIEGLNFGNPHFCAVFKFDAEKQCLRSLPAFVDSVYVSTAGSDVYNCYLWPIFLPVYETFTNSSPSYYVVWSPTSENDVGEIWLTRNSQGYLFFGLSDTPDIYNCTANGFYFHYYNRHSSQFVNVVTATLTMGYMVPKSSKSMISIPRKNAIYTPEFLNGLLPTR